MYSIYIRCGLTHEEAIRIATDEQERNHQIRNHRFLGGSIRLKTTDIIVTVFGLVENKILSGKYLVQYGDVLLFSEKNPMDINNSDISVIIM